MTAPNIVIYMVTRRHTAALPSTISAADFKATCLELMDRVATTGRSVVVTKRGRPVAVMSPVRAQRRSAFGCLKGRIEVLGDLVAPIDVLWDADR
jgi:prevent-host-death family protein